MAAPRVHPTAQIGKGVRIAPDTIVKAGAVLYPGARVGRNVTIYENSVLGRPPQSAGNLTRKPKTNLAPLEIGDNCVIGACAILYGGSSFGKNVLVGDLASVREECTVGDFVVLARGVTVNYGARIGARTKIMDQSHITGGAIIEEDCFISTHVAMSNDNSIGRNRKPKLDPPIIRRGVGIGLNATLLPGVEIGEYSVVGAGSVVTRDVPPRSIAMGVPARVTGPNKKFPKA
jgi:acetyltransferase-like isoleucine patch superfamily enzyme